MTASLAHCSNSGCVGATVGSHVGPGSADWKNTLTDVHVPSGRHCSGDVAVVHVDQSALDPTSWPTGPANQPSTSTLVSVRYCSTETQFPAATVGVGSS